MDRQDRQDKTLEIILKYDLLLYNVDKKYKLLIHDSQKKHDLFIADFRKELKNNIFENHIRERKEKNILTLEENKKHDTSRLEIELTFETQTLLETKRHELSLLNF